MKSAKKLRGKAQTTSVTDNDDSETEFNIPDSASGSESDFEGDEVQDPRFSNSKVSEKKLSSATSTKKETEEKKLKAGVIYLSTIPPKMNVTRIREYFSQFGDINRSFLQPEDKPWKGKRKVKNQTFTEGWIEFKKRKYAKRVTKMLNNQPVGGKKSKAYHDHLWNIKYLQGFQWVHLNERLAYERISRQQKLRNEISAAKRESSFFAKNVDLSKKLKKRGILNKPPPKFKTEETLDGSDIIAEKSLIKHEPIDETKDTTNVEKLSTKDDSTKKKRKRVSEDQTMDRSKFLKSIFGK